MKRQSILMAIIILCSPYALGQKRYDMVINLKNKYESIDVDDINRIYFEKIKQEVSEEESEEENGDNNNNKKTIDYYTLDNDSLTGMAILDEVYKLMYTSGWSTTGNTHQCFGISAYNLCADVMGDDHIMADQGNGWFWSDATYNVKVRYTSTAWRSYDVWNAHFTWINMVNRLITMNKNKTLDTETMNLLGQAYAIRAYSYFMLAQYYARTYKGHEHEPCVPIYTEPFNAEIGRPRATIQEVYTQINSDIALAVDYLGRSSLDLGKTFISYPVALGLQARIALTQENWHLAAEAAEKAINNKQYKFIIQPVSPLVFKANTTNFINDLSYDNVMWGASITAENSGIYASLYSHLDAAADMYGGYDAAPKCINRDIYSLMSSKDARRCWWDPKDMRNPYQQEKFHFSNISTYLGDYVWMRIEEMYLIAAEAQCMLGNEETARIYLNKMVVTRDPTYNCTATGKQLGKLTSDRTGALREAIIDQRRIELWGEYGRVYDIRRLKQGFIRTVAQGWPNNPNILLTNRPSDNPENYMWVLTIPQVEFDRNNNMNESSDQNPNNDHM